MTDPGQSGPPLEQGSAPAVRGDGEAGGGPQEQGPAPPRQTTLDQGWRRLHPLSPLVRSGRGLVAVLALLGLSTSGVLGGATGTRWYDLALPVLVAVAALVNWFVTRWKVDGATLRIETGLLRRDSRQLPLTRIQAVDLVRPFFARMLGLAEIRVRLAGSGDADGRLAYLTEAAAFALRARLLAAHHGLDPATPEPAESVVTSVGTGRLVGSALISAVPLAAVAVAVGAVIVALTPGGLLAAGAPLAWWLIVCGSIIRTAWIRDTGIVSATVPSSPRRIRTPSGETATVNAYWVETRRQAIVPQMISHHTSGAPTASNPPGVRLTITAPAATATAASSAAGSTAEPTSRPVGTEVTTLSAGSGVAGSRPWWAASRRARSSSAPCSVR